MGYICTAFEGSPKASVKVLCPAPLLRPPHSPKYAQLLSSHTSKVPSGRHVQGAHLQFPCRQCASCLWSPFATAFLKWGRCSHSTQQAAKSLSEEESLRTFPPHKRAVVACWLWRWPRMPDVTCSGVTGSTRAGKEPHSLPGAHRACGPGKHTCPDWLKFHLTVTTMTSYVSGLPTALMENSNRNKRCQWCLLPSHQSNEESRSFNKVMS